MEMFISTEYLDSIFFIGLTPLFNLEILPKLKILLKTVRQHNSTEIAQQNFVKLCSYEVTSCVDMHFYMKC